MLEAVLQRKPSTWEPTSYRDVRYVNFVLRKDDSEYKEILTIFGQLEAKISEVKRVQNPYLFGRFLLRKEQMEVTRGTVAEVRRYLAIFQDDVDKICEHNLDPRRYKKPLYQDTKHPVFYNTPNSAYEHFSGSPCAMVVVRVLDDGAGSINMKWDTEYYPEYLVFLD